MKVIVDIKDNRAEAVLGVLENIKGVRSLKPEKPLSKSAQKIGRDLKEAVEEIKAAERAGARLTDARTFLNELQG